MYFCTIPSYLQLLIVVCVIGHLSAVNVTFITITSFQYLMVIPGYEAGIDFIHRVYQGAIHVNHVVIYRSSIYSCQTMAEYFNDIAAQYYYSKKQESDLYVFMAPLCSGELLPFLPLAKEWNTPVITVVGTDPIVQDKVKTPTILTASPLHYVVMGNFMSKFLLSFGWRIIFMLCDDNPIVNFYIAICRNFKTSLKAPAFQLQTVSFDSRKTKLTDFDLFLGLIEKSARVIIISARSAVTRDILIRAHGRNMTKSDYIYFFLAPWRSLPDFPDIAWQMNDADDQIAFDAFKSLLAIAFDNERNIDALPISDHEFIVNRSRDAYNISFLPEEKIFTVTVAAFESALVFGQVINESLSSDPSSRLSDGKKLTKRFWNRTFLLPTGKLYFNEFGERCPDILVRQLNWTSGAINPVLFYTASENHISLIGQRNLVWRNGNAPLNEPLCGFKGDSVACLMNDGFLKTIIAVVATISILAVTAMSGTVILKWKMLSFDPWWSIPEDNILPITRRTTTINLHKSRA